jgi:hypothetical protein
VEARAAAVLGDLEDEIASAALKSAELAELRHNLQCPCRAAFDLFSSFFGNMNSGTAKTIALPNNYSL